MAWAGHSTGSSPQARSRSSDSRRRGEGEVRRHIVQALAGLLALAVNPVLPVMPGPGPGTGTGEIDARHGVAAAVHTITWDQYSLKIDGSRVFIWSGEF